MTTQDLTTQAAQLEKIEAIKDSVAALFTVNKGSDPYLKTLVFPASCSTNLFPEAPRDAITGFGPSIMISAARFAQVSAENANTTVALVMAVMAHNAEQLKKPAADQVGCRLNLTITYPDWRTIRTSPVDPATGKGGNKQVWVELEAINSLEVVDAVFAQVIPEGTDPLAAAFLKGAFEANQKQFMVRQTQRAEQRQAAKTAPTAQTFTE